MNKAANNFLLIGDKYMAEFHLVQPEFSYNACIPLTKHSERIQNFIETVILDKVFL